ncbi:MAG: hypothetical protein ACFFDT_40530, partial [Candidatus Hodarchaeota archaeon]
MVSVYSTTKTTEPSNRISSRTSEASHAVFSVSDNSGPVIGTPTLDNPNPNSNEAVDVTVPINDIDGLQNATLFWEYTVNNTQLNSTVFSTTINNFINVIDTDFDALSNGITGDITGTGLKDPATPTYWRYGEYAYNASAVSEVDLTVVGPGAQTSLVYVLIKAKNFTTGNWQIVYENGGYGLNDSYDLGAVNYPSTTPTLGYYILAVTYRNEVDRANDPQFQTLI